jgi:sugar O-acyltransferase (sialic acid O-acetyltransferase NeuD family)
LMYEINRIVIWGSSGHARVLADIINLDGRSVVALFDNNTSVSSCLEGVPVFHGEAGFKDWLGSQKSLVGTGAVIAIGGSRGKERLELASLLQTGGLPIQTLVHPAAVVSSAAEIGEGCQILANSTISVDVKLGRLCIINHGASVDHECTLGSGVHLAPGSVLCGCVIVEPNAMIGAGAVVLPRLRIGKNAIVGAGSVVTRDVPDGAIVMGNPAKIVRNLDD